MVFVLETRPWMFTLLALAGKLKWKSKDYPIKTENTAAVC